MPEVATRNQALDDWVLVFESLLLAKVMAGVRDHPDHGLGPHGAWHGAWQGTGDGRIKPRTETELMAAMAVLASLL